jgi:hypothetical protein
LDRFEEFTGHRDFKAFHVEQAIAFKKADLPDFFGPVATGEWR